MIAIGIIFLILFAFFTICLIGVLSDANKYSDLMLKRQDEIIRLLKNSNK